MTKAAKPAKTGRPCSLTPDVLEAARKARRAGLSWEDTAALAGVGVRTLMDWLALGRADEEGGRESIFSHFLQVTTRARAEKRLSALDRLEELGEGVLVEEEGKDGEVRTYRTAPDARALTWFLERSDPEQFGRTRVDLGDGAGVIVRVVTGVPASPEDQTQLPSKPSGKPKTFDKETRP